MNRNVCITSIVFLFLWLPVAGAAGPDVSAVNRGRLVQAYGRLPMSFEANRGQTDPRVRFLGRGSSYTLFLTEDEAVLALRNSDGNVAVRVKPVGANPRTIISGIDELPGRSNYFIGTDPKQWHTGVPTYAAVKYDSVYPGIDLIYHGSQGQLEYDFRLNPGADPHVIELSFPGGSKLTVNRSGELIIKLAGGELIEHAPVIFQENGGQRHAVEGRYVLRGKGRVGFRLGNYDRSRPLVIDPTLVYSTYLGGSANDQANSIAIDTRGNTYITGFAQSIDFPTTMDAYQPALKGFANVFVSKMNPAGSALLYSTYLGGSGSDTGLGIAVDDSGNAYVTGSTRSSDFPTTPGAFQRTFGGTLGFEDAFVSKLDATGSALVYSTYLAGSLPDFGNAIAVDTAGNAYVTGETVSPDFPTTPGAFQPIPGFGFGRVQDAFVTKLNTAGSALVYSTYLGSTDSAGNGIAVDTTGNAYIAGFTNSSNFPTTSGAFQTSSGGGGNAFLTKLNAFGSALIYSTYLSGSADDLANGVAIDGAGNAYVTGKATSANFPTTPGAFQTVCKGCNAASFTGDAFITKLNPTGSTVVYSSFLGGSGDDEGRGIAIDSAGNVFITGNTRSSDFPTTRDGTQTTFGGGYTDAFFSTLNGSASALRYSTYLGGNDIDNGTAIAVDGTANSYIAGYSFSMNFPTTSTALQSAFGGVADAFITKFSFGVPFSCLTGKLEIDEDKHAFDLQATFSLGSGGSIDPLNEAVSLTVGPYSVTVPAGSFVKDDEGYRFEGTIDGVRLELSIKHQRCHRDGDAAADEDGRRRTKCKCTAETYQFSAEAKGTNLEGATNPITVSISIGDNTGSAQINARSE